MRLSERFTKDCVIINSKAQAKEEILHEMVSLLTTQYGVPKIDEIYDSVISRERKMSTGIGCGLAVPHAKCDQVDRMCVVAATVPRGIDFAAIDKQPVYLLFLIVSPSHSAGPHIRALSAISRIMSDAEVRAKLEQAQTSDLFHQILREAEEKYH